MGQVLHGCATTTEAVRRAIQHSQESLRVLAKRYGIKATSRVAGEFMRALIEAVPYRINTVLPDNGIHFTDPRSPGSAVFAIKQAIEAGKVFRAHAFE